ncbi:MAG: SprB repeat-containing protein [Bacteroidetes bacterium]|nr:SprB repeat-containing protein [Bacteroidota bacterium]
MTTPQQSTAYIGNLCAGVYLVEVEDATVPGCLDTVSALINENGAQPITATATNATCSNLCDGTATVNFTGGCLDPPCTVQWLDSMGTPLGQSGTIATGLCHGSYLVHVINGIGCNSYAQVSVSVPNPIVPNLTTTVNSCGSNCNGSITAAPSGGTPPYSFAWLDAGGVPIAGQSGATIINRCTGNYFSRITDLSGCVVTTPVSIYGNPFVSSASSSPVACNGNCSGIITAVSSGSIIHTATPC